MKGEKKRCENCSSYFGIKDRMGVKRWSITKYCSRKCYNRSLLGRKMTESAKEKLRKRMQGNKYTLGRKQSEDHKRKIKKAISGEKNYAWKGEDASYKTKHNVINKLAGNPKKCEICKTTDGKKTYDWACKNHKYTRNPNDYIRLCRKCHKEYDKKFNNKKYEKGRTNGKATRCLLCGSRIHTGQ